VSLDNAPMVGIKVQEQNVKENSAVVARVDEIIKSLDQSSGLILDKVINLNRVVNITYGKGVRTYLLYIRSYLCAKGIL
jgi:hypothetical protein